VEGKGKKSLDNCIAAAEIDAKMFLGLH